MNDIPEENFHIHSRSGEWRADGIRFASAAGSCCNHCDDGLGNFGVEAGKAVAVFAIPAALDEVFDFGRLPGLVAQHILEHGQCGLEISPDLGFEFLSGTNRFVDFGDGIVVEVHGWESPFPPVRFQVLMSDGAT